MRAVKAGLLLSCLAALAPDGSAAVRHFGRRLVTGPNNLLALTDGQHDKVALFDVSGPSPLLRAEFGVSGGRAGQFRGPHGATFAGNALVIADSLNHRLESFDLAALLAGHGPRLVRAWGRFGNGVGEFDTPTSGLAWLTAKDRQGTLLVADTRNQRIVSVDAAGHSLGRVLGRSGPADHRLDWPSGIAVDTAHAVVYVADQGARRVLAFDARSGAVLFTTGPELQVPVDVAVDARGEVWVIDQARRRVVRFTPVLGRSGRVQRLREEASWGRVGGAAGAWNYPQSIAVDAQGRVYVADGLDGRCQMFSREGAFIAAFGSDVGAGSVRSFGPAPGPWPAGPVEVCTNGEGYRLELTLKPEPLTASEYATLDIDVRDGCRGGPTARGITLDVDAWMPEHGHGMNTRARVEPRRGGGFSAAGLLLHMPGRWQLFVDVARAGVVERAQVDFVLP